MKICIKKDRSSAIKLIKAGMILALFGFCDLFISIDKIMQMMHVIIVLLLCFTGLHSCLHRQKIKRFDISDISAVMFLVYIIMTLIWDKGRKPYDFMINFIFILSALTFYYMNKCFGDIEKDTRLFILFKITQYINLVLVFIQITFFKINSDFANGIFGSYGYYNGVQGLFCIICCITGLYMQAVKQQNMKQTILTILISCLICALSEIKAFFFLLFLVCGMYLILEFRLDKKTLKRMLLFCGTGLGILLASFSILGGMYRQNTVVFKSVNSLNRYIGFSNGSYDPHSRLGAIFACFNNDTLTVLFGRGFQGQTGYSAYGFANLLNASGIVGCTLFIVFIFANIITAKKYGKCAINVHFSCIYGAVCLLALVVWAGIFGSIVSSFSLLFLSMLHHPITDKCQKIM